MRAHVFRGVSKFGAEEVEPVTTQLTSARRKMSDALPVDVSKRRSRASREELEIVERLLAGDESAFRWVVERYHGRLRRLALVFLSNPATAEEVVQDTWLAVLAGLPNFQRRSHFQAWIFRILANRAKTRAIRDGRTLPFSALLRLEEEPAIDPIRFTAEGTWAEPPFPWNADTPEQLLLRGEAMAHLQNALTGLSANQRAVVTLRDIEGLDAEDVCNILEISETNQRVLLHRARSKLRSALEQYMGGGRSWC